MSPCVAGAGPPRVAAFGAATRWKQIRDGTNYRSLSRHFRNERHPPQKPGDRTCTFISAVLLATGILIVVGIDPTALSSGRLEPSTWACSSTRPVTTICVFPCLGIRFETTIDADGNRTCTFTNTSNKPKSGCVTFLDSDGNPLGTPTNIDLPPGGSTDLPVPDGATDVEISDEPCDEPEPEPDKIKQMVGSSGLFPSTTRAQAAQQSTAIGIAPKPRKTKYSFLNAPIEIDPFEDSRTFAITVHTAKRRHAEAIRNHVKEFGFDLPLPKFASVSDVEVDYYLDTHVDYTGMDIEFIYASDDAFASLALEVNGIPNVVTLPQGTPVVTGNGWDAVKLSLAFGDRSLEYDPTSGAQWQNEFEAVITTTDPFELSPFVARGDLTFVAD